MSASTFRLEEDSLGEVRVPVHALYGAQTQRAVENFPISGLRFPRAFIRALGMIKGAAAAVNREIGLLDAGMGDAIELAAREVEQGHHDEQFPVDVYQTGSGTSTNMNANEVIATLASSRLGRRVHHNDHVNLGQSSNDVIPTAISLSAYMEVTEQLLPALRHVRQTIDEKADALKHVVKTGRTHLMDALPIRMSQELSGWSKQIQDAGDRLESTLPRLAELAVGGTAVGTGANAPAGFGRSVAALLAERSGQPFSASRNYFASISSPDAAIELSGHLKAAAVALSKIANDLRWMNSGPGCGLAEIRLPALQPGSSMMPGKVNPVIPEAVLMVCARVIGNDASITLAGQSGNFQLNVMLPLIAYCLLESIGLLARVCHLLADTAIRPFEVNQEAIRARAERNPMLATALNPLIGYEQSARIVQRAIEENRPIKDVAAEMTDLKPEELDRLLDLERMTG
jgi:fumarate hydratase, class II